MTIQKHSKSISVKVGFDLQYLELSHGQAAYRLERGPLPDQPSLPQLEYKLSRDIEEGITTVALLDSFLKGKASKLEAQQVYAVKPELLDAVRTLGFSEAMEQYGQSLSLTPFSDLSANGVEGFSMIRIDTSSHMVFDLDEVSLPVAMHFDYMNGFMKDGAYNLEKALELLQADPRVRFAADLPKSKGGKETPFIQNVPSYNARNGSSQFLSFWFMPTAEDAKRLWEKQLSYKTKYPSTTARQAVFDLDVLGLRAGGAAKYKDFHESDEYV